MATVSPTENLGDEATCSICLDYFKDPVIVTCGHNFCRSCITQCWEGLDENFVCPQCRETSQQRILIPNRQLANVIEITLRLLQRTIREPADILCEKHNETLKLFCENDEKPVCLVCGFSQDHDSHTMRPIEEAMQQYKATFQQSLDRMRSNLGNIQTLLYNEQEKISKLKKQLKIKRQRIISEFEELRQLVNEQQQVALARLEEEEREILEKLNKNISTLAQQSSSLENLIVEIEEKQQQPATDFLKGVKTILSRGGSMTFQQPEVFNFEVRKTSSDILCQNIALQNILKKLKVSAVSVTLDPQTANPYLILSADRKHVRWENSEQSLPMTPKRFDAYPCVLGFEGFTSGTHYWEVHIEDERDWSVGAARESVSRNGGNTPSNGAKRLNQNIFSFDQHEVTFNSRHPLRCAPQKGDIVESPERGIWALEHRNGHYQALTSPVTPLSIKVRPQNLIVYLDYAGGLLSFYNADTMGHLYTFNASFTEKMFPYFCIWDGTAIRL